MKNVTVDSCLQLFIDTATRLKVDLRDDTSWPVINDEILKTLYSDKYNRYWEKLLEHFLEQEKEIGHCHKGLIYWRLAEYQLLNGNIENAISLLKLSKDQDLIKLNGVNTNTTSIGLLSVLNPLLERYKDGKGWKLDKEVNTFYQSLDKSQKEKFALAMFESHNLTARQQVWIIKDDYFGFIVDERTRSVIFQAYKEVREIVLKSNLESYYSCIFAIGSITEGMLDDLFTRDDQAVWKKFKSIKGLKIDKKSKINSTKYSSGMTLGQKIQVLRFMTEKGCSPISHSSILQLIIIGEYRDLIHPRRRIEFEYEANRYVATFLFTMISKVAGDWWPENVNKRLTE